MELDERVERTLLPIKLCGYVYKYFYIAMIATMAICILYKITNGGTDLMLCMFLAFVCLVSSLIMGRLSEGVFERYNNLRASMIHAKCDTWQMWVENKWCNSHEYVTIQTLPCLVLLAINLGLTLIAFQSGYIFDIIMGCVSAFMFCVVLLYLISLIVANKESIMKSVLKVDERRVNMLFNIWIFGWWMASIFIVVMLALVISINFIVFAM